MKISDLVFVGIYGYALALSRTNGEQLWKVNLSGYDMVNIVVDGNVLLATSNGEIYCLNPLTGATIWHNQLKGMGTGLAAIATVRNPGNNAAALAAQQASNESDNSSTTTT